MGEEVEMKKRIAKKILYRKYGSVYTRKQVVIARRRLKVFGGTCSMS
jgi:hypothetical protein